VKAYAKSCAVNGLRLAAVFYLERNRRGAFVPHLRGLGLQKIDAAGRVRGTSLTLDQVRRDVRAGDARRP
jgi:hypothetical protein